MCRPHTWKETTANEYFSAIPCVTHVGHRWDTGAYVVLDFLTKISHWFYKYWGFLLEITTGIAACQMVIFLTSLTYTVTWNLKKYYFFSTSFLRTEDLWGPASSRSISTACSAVLCLPKPAWRRAWPCTSEDLQLSVLLSRAEALIQGLTPGTHTTPFHTQPSLFPMSRLYFLFFFPTR